MPALIQFDIDLGQARAIGIAAHLAREQAILLRCEMLDRFEHGLICGFGSHNDLLSLALNLLTNGFGIQNLNRFVFGRSSGRSPDLIRCCARESVRLRYCPPL
jgi:hypothetical protein